ncbi:ATP-binding protein [Herbidospora galbida]|uniref:ATP-binding protein n=1 Tax=Herbidospora galbida TaxID=2575442 RepID=A0A4U3MNE4_9ACTN|nr:ATP-binding protein [Herbidospora galbida]TKK90550.1 ATP-binding protein [Herbidospora galbida]
MSATGAGVEATFEIPGDAEAVSFARAEVRKLLADVGAPEGDTLVLLSEVVTNAVRHTLSGQGGHVVIAVAECGDGLLHLEVLDDGSDSDPTLPPMDDLTVLEESGRGLWLVSQLAHQWGWYGDTYGRCVWFRVKR